MSRKTRSGAGLAIGLAVIVGLAWPLVPAAQNKIHKVKLGPQVNSGIREGFPIVSPDGKTLYFIRENYQDEGLTALMNEMPKATDEKAVKEWMEKLSKTAGSAAIARAPQTIWSSERQGDGHWGRAQILPEPVNSEFNAFVFSVLPDNNTLFIGRPKGMLPELMRGDDAVSFARRTKDGWSLSPYLNIKNFQNVSPRFGFALAPSGKALLLAINNGESLGGIDVYVSFPQSDGTWSRPKNLGPAVNSPRNEYGMFFAPDDQAVYFASERDGGFGGTDVYLMRRLDDTWLKWSAPQNLGPEINDEKNQESLSVDASGQFAFTAEGERFKEDIYEFALPVSLRPAPVAFVRGKVQDPGKNPLGAVINYERLRDGYQSGSAGSHPGTGRYQIALPLGENYGFLADAPGYYPVSDNLDLSQAKEGQVFDRDLTLIPIQLKKPIRLNNIFFKSDKSELLPESKRELDRLVALLLQYPRMEIEIDGHTDSQNTEDYNRKLSEARARAVVDYLAKAGIAASRLTSQGFGEARPVASNDTKEGRQLNRRVEFVILKM